MGFCNWKNCQKNCSNQTKNFLLVLFKQLGSDMAIFTRPFVYWTLKLGSEIMDFLLLENTPHTKFTDLHTHCSYNIFIIMHEGLLMLTEEIWSDLNSKERESYKMYTCMFVGIRNVQCTQCLVQLEVRWNLAKQRYKEHSIIIYSSIMLTLNRWTYCQPLAFLFETLCDHF